MSVKKKPKILPRIQSIAAKEEAEEIELGDIFPRVEAAGRDEFEPKDLAPRLKQLLE